MKTVFDETHKAIGLLCKLVLVLPRSSWLMIYKSFVRLHLDYGDIIYDKAYNTTFHQVMEAVQYNAALTIFCAVSGSSKETKSMV